MLFCFTISSCSKDDDNANDENGNIDIPLPQYAVDLGLPSGTLWADRNVGADSSEDYGDYFAWGETEPKSAYVQNTYKWGNYGQIITVAIMTKYCTDSDFGYEGFTDGKSTLEPSDDAATANWGDEWCMPTSEQFEELENECTWTWITKNGVKGCKVTGTNGKSIFLPAAGFRYDNDLRNAGSYGCCWSSSLCEYTSFSAYCFSFFSYSGDHDLSSANRCIGHTVRAVVR